MLCPQCRTRNRDDAAWCYACGASLTASPGEARQATDTDLAAARTRSGSRAGWWLGAEFAALVVFAAVAAFLFVADAAAPSDAAGSAFLGAGVVVLLLGLAALAAGIVWLLVAAMRRRAVMTPAALTIAGVLAVAGGGVVVTVSPATPFQHRQVVSNTAGLDLVVSAGLTPVDGVRIVIPPGSLARDEVEIMVAQLNARQQGTLGDHLRDDAALFAQFGDLAGRVAADGEAALFHPFWFPLLLAEADIRPFDAAVRLGPEGTQFRSPVRIEIPLTTLGAGAGTSAPPDLFVLLGSDQPDGSVRWELVRDSRVDAQSGMLVVEATHFSRLVVYGVDVLDVVRRWGPRLTSTLAVDLANQVRLGSAASVLAEAERGFVVQSTLSPFDPFAQATSCTGIAPRAPAASSVPPLGSLLAHLSGFADPNAISTPHEQALTDYILDPARRERLTAAGIYAKAYQLSGGDVFQALLTSHEVLRSHFRAGEFGKTGVTPRPAEIADRVMPMVGDGKDETGALYHFFGMAVYGYAQAYYRDRGTLGASAGALALPPDLIAHAEERLVSGDFWTEPRELLVDLKGGALGQRLSRDVSGLPLGMLGANRLPPGSDACARVLTDRQSEYAVLVAAGGDGSGTVTSVPPGVSCPGTCVALFPPGTVVQLIATPARDSTFEGWSGACAGTGTCTLELFRDLAATATFAPSSTSPAAPAPPAPATPTPVPVIPAPPTRTPTPPPAPPAPAPTAAPTAMPTPAPTVAPTPALPVTRTYAGTFGGSFGGLAALNGCAWEMPFTMDLTLTVDGSPASTGSGTGFLTVMPVVTAQPPDADCLVPTITGSASGPVTASGADVQATLTSERLTVTFVGALSEDAISGNAALIRQFGTTSTFGDTSETLSASVSGVTLTRVN